MTMLATADIGHPHALADLPAARPGRGDDDVVRDHGLARGHAPGLGADALPGRAMTSSVQAGFVGGTLTSALLSAADRYDPRNLFMTAAAIAGAACLLIVFFAPTDIAVPILRFATVSASPASIPSA